MSWVIVFCSFLGAFCLLTGLLIGATVGRRQLARELRDEADAQRASAWLGQIRAAETIDPERQQRREAMARRTHPVFRELPPAVVRDDLTDSAYTADMAARMDRFLEGLCGVPYSADELWSGQ